MSLRHRKHKYFGPTKDSLDFVWIDNRWDQVLMHTVASLDQAHFRFRNDDGSETEATWVDNEDTNASLNVDTNYRIRFTVDDTANGVESNVTFRLQCNNITQGTGWLDVDGSSSSLHIRSVDSPHYADADNTTSQLTVPTGGSFITPNSGMDEDDGGGSAGIAGDNNDIDFVEGTHDYVEIEYCFQVRSADVVSGDNIQLRVRRVQGGTLDSYSVIPQITVSSGPTTSGVILTAKTSTNIGYTRRIESSSRLLGKSILSVSSPLIKKSSIILLSDTGLLSNNIRTIVDNFSLLSSSQLQSEGRLVKKSSVGLLLSSKINSDSIRNLIGSTDILGIGRLNSSNVRFIKQNIELLSSSILDSSGSNFKKSSVLLLLDSNLQSSNIRNISGNIDILGESLVNVEKKINVQSGVVLLSESNLEILQRRIINQSFSILGESQLSLNGRFIKLGSINVLGRANLESVEKLSIIQQADLKSESKIIIDSAATINQLIEVFGNSIIVGNIEEKHIEIKHLPITYLNNIKALVISYTEEL